MKKIVLLVLIAVVVLGVLYDRLRAQGQTLPTVGASAPDFTLPSQDGTGITLSSFQGKFVVLYFYPKDATPGCTIEAHNFQRDLVQYEQKNAVILGVSEDTVASHQSFCTKESLSFRLLADTEHTVATAYGSLGGFAGVKIANRNTFLIGPDGKILKVWTGVKPATHSAEVLSELAGAPAH
jgi:thioredoxin-dependent peroxiredoxin